MVRVGMCFTTAEKIGGAARHGGGEKGVSVDCYDVSINCGSTGKSITSDGREWLGDAQPNFSTLLQIKGSSAASSVIHSLVVADDPVPYKTARLSRSQFSYAFQVNPGQKLLRLHFNPALYKGFKRFKDLFDVQAGPFNLLSNFSASLTADALGVNSFIKEYYVNIQDNQPFNVVLSPSSSQSFDTYAFINGFEILSLPPTLSYFHGGDIGLQEVGKSLVFVENSTALEIIHQQNLRQDSVPSAGDIRYKFGIWETIAKQKQSKMKHITWKTSVDVGFRYLVRLYFSSLGLKMVETGGVIFKVSINEMLANTNIHKDREMDDEGSIPMYRDYIVMMKGSKQEGKRDLLICLESNGKLIDGHGPFEGFEIMKLSNPLASPNPLSSVQDSSYWTLQYLYEVLGGKNMIATVVITLLALANIAIYTSRKFWEARRTEEKNMVSARAERLCRRFSLAEIQLATRNFSDAYLIGKGGFGKVYKGVIDNGQGTVAIKRLKPNSTQGAREFLTEIETLTVLQHVNLVSLIGYCNEHSEMILVYEYMACGTLADHLYKLGRNNDNYSLTWKQLLTICIGAGRGLDYLHTGNLIIHRDVKASNILLDENFTAKVSDFGLAKNLSRSKLQSHVSTKVKGTYGYLDPSYSTTGRLTKESDIYAFGVVLFEVLSGRPPVDPWAPEDERILIMWARENISNGNAEQIVASNLRGEISEGSLKAFVEVAERCLHYEPRKRPTMVQVVLQLEVALEHQERSQFLVSNGRTSDVNDIHPSDQDRRITSNLDDIHHSGEETNLSDCTRKPTRSSTDVQNPGLPLNEHTSGNERKAPSHKSSRLWPWAAFRNRVKPSGKNELLWLAEEDLEVHLGQLKRFSLRELKVATDNFSNKNILGSGGFFEFYKGRLADGSLVAVKRLKERTQGGALQFQTEVEMISLAVHRNLLRLRGFCMTPTERLLVYPYMVNGRVASCLRERPESQPPLDWPIRKRIALGSARGLAYLHDHCDPKIIHRDIKAANILLDEDFEAVVGDFGFAKLMDCEDTHVITVVHGTIGHIAPEYISTGKSSEKTDVFGYGVMLLELISGPRAFDLPRLANDDDVVLLDWVKGLLKEKKLEALIDADLQGNYIDEEVEQLIQVAVLCTQSSPMERPKMSEVVRMLEGDGLAERWEEWQTEEIFRQGFNNMHTPNNGWLNFDSTSNIRPTELSGPR